MLDQLEESMRRLIFDVCELMHRYGFSEVSMGAIMRLMGIDEKTSARFDNELIVFDEDFERVVEYYKKRPEQEVLKELPPAGTTLH